MFNYSVLHLYLSFIGVFSLHENYKLNCLYYQWNFHYESKSIWKIQIYLQLNELEIGRQFQSVVILFSTFSTHTHIRKYLFNKWVEVACVHNEMLKCDWKRKPAQKTKNKDDTDSKREKTSKTEKTLFVENAHVCMTSIRCARVLFKKNSFTKSPYRNDDDALHTRTRRNAHSDNQLRDTRWAARCHMEADT